MDPDLALVLGLVLVVLSVPSILSALSDSRGPRASAITILIGGGLVVYALQSSVGGYSLEELPEVFSRVLANYVL